MSEHYEEKRKFKRVEFDTEAYLTSATTKWPTELIDISLKGVLLKTPLNWNGSPGEEYDVNLVLGGDNICISMKVAISHIENGCVGCYCEHIDLESIAHLKRLLELNLGDAELVNRELSSLGL